MGENESKRMTQRVKIALAVFSVCSVCLGSYIMFSGGSQPRNPVPTHEQEEKHGGHMNSEQENQPNNSPLSIFGEEKTPERVEESDSITVEGRSFYLMDGDVLIPLDRAEWSRYDVPGGEEYDGISEFYISGESPQEWTQKFTVHRMKASSGDCLTIADKVINGLIANIASSMEADGLEFTKDNLSVVYAKKDSDNTLFFWGKKHIKNLPDETQFVRLFKAPYSGKMYFVTYTLKSSIDDFSAADEERNLKMLNGIQELKKIQ